MPLDDDGKYPDKDPERIVVEGELVGDSVRIFPDPGAVVSIENRDAEGKLVGVTHLDPGWRGSGANEYISTLTKQRDELLDLAKEQREKLAEMEADRDEQTGMREALAASSRDRIQRLTDRCNDLKARITELEDEHPGIPAVELIPLLKDRIHDETKGTSGQDP